MRLPRSPSPIAALLAALVVSTPVGAEAQSRELSLRLAGAYGAIDSDPQLATELLDALRPKSEPVEDYVAYLRAMTRQQADDEAAARSGFAEVVETWPASPVAARAAARLAPLLSRAHDTAGALALAERYVPDSGPAPFAPPVALAAGETLADSDPQAAARWLMRARRLAGGGAAGQAAASLLNDLRRRHPGLQPSSPSALLEEAKLSGREGNTQAQAATLDQILHTHRDDPSFADAALLRARLIGADKGRLESAAWLEEQADRSSTTAARARLLFAAATDRWNTDDNAGARTVFARVVALGTRGAEEQQAQYSLGRIEESEDRYTNAATHYQMAANGPTTSVARESRWRTGWVAYLAGDFATAAQRFEEVASTPIEPAAREEALYWQARSLERSGAETRATEAYRDLIASFPDGFYSLLAEARTGTKAPAPRVADLAAGEPTQTILRGVERARILQDAGLHELAQDEMRAAAVSSDGVERRALLPELVELGAYDQALRNALELYHSGALREDQLYPFLYPHAYASIVDREARTRGVDPFLVYSLIRQESLFDRRAVSPASAYGLMQLLLPTARRMAASNPEIPEPSRDDLFRPEVNIPLGITYLAELGNRFGNDEVFILAGYNAGENAAQRWRDRLGHLDRDELVERISYRETRDYVKKVLRNYRNYRRLYGDPGVRNVVKRGK